MNLYQAAKRWAITEETAEKICAQMKLDPENIPEDLRPVYTSDEYMDDPHRVYMVLLEVIMNTHVDIGGIDPDVLKTCLEQLRKENLIVAKNGKDPESDDYHDYILSTDKNKLFAWYESRLKDNLNLFRRILSLLRTLF